MTNAETTSELRRRLLERLRRGELAVPEGTAEPPIPRVSGEEIPLSCGQQQVWLHSQFALDAPIYNESVTVRKRGPLDPAVLEAAFNEIVRRHAIWRTGFVNASEDVSGKDNGGKVTQHVYPLLHVPLPVIDFSHFPAAEAADRAICLAREDARRIFDLSEPPLLRARLVRLAWDDHRLYLTFHHLLFDGVSLYRVFLPELAAIYRSYLAGQPSPLPELPIQYGDYAVWQQGKLAAGHYAHQLNYWRETLSVDEPPVELPIGHARQDVSAWSAGIEKFELSRQLSQAIRQFAASAGATLYMVLLAAFHVLIHRYSGQAEITTGGVVSTRNRAELEPLIGFMLNTVVLRSRVDSSLDFREYLRQIRNSVLNALANSDIPFDTVVRELAPKRDSKRNAFFRILFSLRPAATELPDGWDLTELDVHSGASGFELFVDVIEKPENLSGRIIYSAARFEPAAISRMSGHLRNLLEAIVGNTELPLGRLPLLTDRERQNLIEAGAGPRVDLPDKTISELFEHAAAQVPAQIAVVFEERRLTFQELDRRANAFAAELRDAGAKSGALVAISVERSLEMAIALIGVLKTGAAYLPVDPDLPTPWREFILNDAKPHLSVTSPALTITRHQREETGHYAGLAYLLYTSGSTGVPKGVEIPETAVVNFLCSMQREPGFFPSDVLLAVTTLSFDIAALEIFLPLVSGGRLFIGSRKTVGNPELLMEAMGVSGCTVMQGTPSLWRSLVDAGWSGNPRLKVLCGGEALSRGLADELLPRCGELWNMYGPTETTIWSTVQKVEIGPRPIPIGRPIGNTQVYVLDREMQLLPIGIAGELCIGGTGVARGYLMRQELTSERFPPNPFLPGGRIYRTGDLARWGSAGELEFLGRNDNQVKVRGYRIELQAIEEALARSPGVRGAAVKAWRDGSGENVLVAYIEGDSDAGALRRHLARILPDYMIPSRFIGLPSLPLTPNGKLDRKALPEPGRERASPMDRSGPRSDTERRMAAIWTALLKTPGLDIDQDFFSLGGHSLLATNLLRRIEAEFGKRLGISSLFEHPTIAGLSALIAPDQELREIDSAVPPDIADGAANSERQILYWIYAGAYCRHLASYLKTTHRFLDVSLPPEIENEIGESDRFEDVARLIANRMRSERRNNTRSNTGEGPYNLGGGCLSGILAYEVAVQLEKMGEEVGFVALVNSPNPRYLLALPRHKRARGRLIYYRWQLMRLDAGEIADYLLDRALSRVRPEFKFNRMLRKLAWRYEPTALRARVVLFQSALRPAGIDAAPGWTNVVEGEFVACEVPGDHDTSFDEPNVVVLAEELKACFR